MSKHTKGPWKLRIDRGVAGEIGTILDANQEEVANLHGPDGTIEPDGKLMAAAPEMLELLIAAAHWIDKAPKLANEDEEKRAVSLINNMWDVADRARGMNLE